MIPAACDHLTTPYVADMHQHLTARSLGLYYRRTPVEAEHRLLLRARVDGGRPGGAAALQRPLHRALRDQLLDDGAQHAAARRRGLQAQGLGQRRQGQRRRRAPQRAPKLGLKPEICVTLGWDVT